MTAEAIAAGDFERDWAEEAYWRDACPECESHHPRNEPCDRELDPGHSGSDRG